MKSTKTCFSFRAQKDMEGRMGVRFVDKRVIAGLAGCSSNRRQGGGVEPARIGCATTSPKGYFLQVLKM
jgi:hypothetical protein